MLSNDPGNKPSEPQASSSKPGTTETSGAIMDPRSPIEVASTGGSTITDPSGKDNKPPAVYESESSFA